MIKTIKLTANVEEKINLLGGTHVRIKNLSNSTVYVSKLCGIVAGADNVKSIQDNTTDIFTDMATYSIQNSVGDYRGTIYALADSDCSIELETTNNSNFKQVVKGGDCNGNGSAFTESKNFVRILNDNVENHIGTKEEI